MKPPLAGRVNMEKAGGTDKPTRCATFVPDDPADAVPELYDVQIRAIMEEEIVLCGISSGMGELGVHHYAQAWRVRPAQLGELVPANRIRIDYKKKR